MSIPRRVKKYRLDEQPKDFVFWQTRSFADRLRALEEIRRDYNAWKYNDRQGLQRVYRIVKQR